MDLSILLANKISEFFWHYGKHSQFAAKRKCEGVYLRKGRLAAATISADNSHLFGQRFRKAPFSVAIYPD